MNELKCQGSSVSDVPSKVFCHRGFRRGKGVVSALHFAWRWLAGSNDIEGTREKYEKLRGTKKGQGERKYPEDE